MGVNAIQHLQMVHGAGEVGVISQDQQDGYQCVPGLDILRLGSGHSQQKSRRLRVSTLVEIGLRRQEPNILPGMSGRPSALLRSAPLEPDVPVSEHPAQASPWACGRAEVLFGCRC
jgi:hypothetical protein